MAQPPDESKSKTLLDPELNPILNPLLAAHMGRWAEVYFTSPPDKREQAVADLLRELAQDAGTSEPTAEPDRRGTPVQRFEARAGFEDRTAFEDRADQYRAAQDRAEDHALEMPELEQEPLEAMEEEEEEDDEQEQLERNPAPSLMEAIGDAFTVCKTCGHINVGGQKFCGMCGRSLNRRSLDNIPSASNERLENPDSASQQTEDQTVAPQFWNDRPTAESRRSEAGDLSTSPIPTWSPKTAPTAESLDHSNQDEPYEDAYGNHEPVLDSKQTLERQSQFAEAPAEFSFAGYEQEPPVRSYRLYIGLVVVVLLALLVYTTWRTNAGNKGSAVAPELPTAVPDSSPPVAASAPSNEPPEAPAQPPSPHPDSTNARAVESPSPNRNTMPAGKTRNLPKPKPQAPQPGATVSPASPPAAAAQNGFDEFAMAEKYLRAGPGGTQQAVPWLWKAVAKQNPAATLMLSDLYLHGEGVPKNCDQARVLLDAAARKGEAAAAERLRNLPSYGCQ